MHTLRDSIRNCSKAKLKYDRDWDPNCVQEITDSLRVHLNFNTLSCEQKDECDSRVDNSEKSKSNSFSKTSIEKFGADESNSSNSHLQEYDRLVNTSFKEKLDSYCETVDTFKKEMCEELEEELNLIRQKYLLRALKRMKHYNEEFNGIVDEVNKKQTEARSKSESVKCKLKEIESKHKKSIDDERQKAQRKVNEERCASITSIKTEAESIIKEIDRVTENNAQLVASVKLSHYVKQQQNTVRMMLNNIDMFLTKSNITQEDVDVACNWKNEIERTRKSFEEQLNDLRRQKNTVDDSLDKEKQKTVESTNEINKKVEEEKCPRKNDELFGYADSKAFKAYVSLQSFFNEFERNLKSFTEDKEFKSYRTDLQLFIRTNVNAISSGSLNHLRDRVKKLTFLFSGKSNEFQDKQINTGKHADAANFCLYWTAKTFISVATKQVMSVPKSAFPMAVVIVILWSRFPVFGKLLLAFLQQKCPYVVPYYPRREADDSETNYLIACGYDYSADGKTLESEELFLNRMRSLIRLYGAIIQTNKQGIHPHGINFGWLFIARVLNLEPRPGVTPAIIHAFLSTSAHKMLLIYRKQFFKILQFLAKDYVPRIEKCSSKEVKKQAVSQLKSLLEEFNKSINLRSTLKAPDGVFENISDNF